MTVTETRARNFSEPSVRTDQRPEQAKLGQHPVRAGSLQNLPPPRARALPTPPVNLINAQPIGPGQPGYVAPPTANNPAPTLTKPPTAARMMTSEGLVQEMGHKPKVGLSAGGHQIRNSDRYRAVLTSLNAYNRELGSTRIPSDGTARVRMVKALDSQLVTLDRAASDHLAKHPNNAAMQKLKAEIVVERNLLRAVLDDARFGDHTLNSNRGFTVQQAMELRRYGIEPSSQITFDEAHTDDQIKKSNEKFASGNANSVAKITYNDGQTKVLKQEAMQRANMKIDIASGLDANQPHYGNRNIATAKLDTLLGTGVAPKTEYVIHNNRLCSTMDFAAGVSGSGQKRTVKLAEDHRIYKAIKKDLEHVKQGDFGVSDLREMYKGYRIEIGRNNKLVKVEQERLVPYDINYNNPGLAKAMNNLEWLDYLTGQGDRHSGNFILSMGKDGTFHGLVAIDNDASFGAQLDDPDKFLERDKETRKAGLGGLGYHGVGMPLLIDRQLADKLRAPGAWNQIETALKGLLTDAEVAAAKARFDKAIIAINSFPPDRIISDWTKATVKHTDPTTKTAYNATPAQVLMDDHERSYLGRSHGITQEAVKDGLKLLRA